MPPARRSEAGFRRPVGDEIGDQIGDGTGDATEEYAARRSVVPPTAGRSLWAAALWTGLGSAAVCGFLAVLAVAVCWLPASGGSGSAGSVLRAGVLTFLAALHGGITVDGSPTAFLPLGLTVLVGAVGWRAGCGLADVADALGEDRPRPLLLAGALQSGIFAVACAIAAAAAPLGTSRVPVTSAAEAGFVLFALTAGSAFVRWSALGEAASAVVPAWVGRVARAAAAGIAVYLGAGALLVAGALVVNHARVTALSAQLGGGWSGLPVLLLGVLAAPNAAIAGAAYLTGPGFAVGAGDHVSLFSAAHGTVPAFPLLGALPDGSGAPLPVWILAAVAPLLAGTAVAAAVRRAPTWALRARDIALAALVAVLAGIALAWQGGGALGQGRLRAVGASPWQFGLALGAALAAGSAIALAVAALAVRLGRGRAGARARARSGAVPDDRTGDRAGDAPGVLRATLASVVAEGVAAYRSTTDPAERDAGPRPVRRIAAARDAGEDELAG